MHAMFLRCVAAPAATLVLAAAPAAAQEPPFPRQMRIVAASVGGTGPDFIARLIAPKLGEAVRQSVIVENRPSANGIAAAAYVAKAPPDGSVTMMGNAGTHAINAALYKKLEYDPLTDFAAITEIASIPLALVVHPSVPAKSVRELVALARKSPGKLNVAIAGAAGELMGNALKLQAKMDMTNIPYKGGAVAAIAVMSGEADMVFTSYVVIAPHVESGRLRVLGVSSGGAHAPASQSADHRRAGTAGLRARAVVRAFRAGENAGAAGAGLPQGSDAHRADAGGEREAARHGTSRRRAAPRSSSPTR